MRNSGVRVRIGVLAIIVALAVFLPASARTARAQSAAGTVSSAGGQVQIQRGGVTLAATPGTPVKQGDKIVSGADGHAVIILTDGSKLELSHSTTITLDQYTSGGPTPTRVGLASGILESVVRGIGGAPANYQVHTPNAIGAVRGTDFFISYTSSSPQLGNLPGISHYTEVAVIDGVVNLAQATAPNSGVDIGPGTTGTVAGNEPPEEHKRKYPTPQPTPTCSSLPVSVDQCKKGGWRQFTCFKNQGQCVSFVRHEK
ncbi:MAG: FecR domain-containing protein [Candidatus Binataceae bacterium]